MIGASWPGRSKENGMKPDPLGKEIRELAKRRGLFFETETVPGFDGQQRLWWFTDRLGRPPLGGEGQGIQDQAALMFLNGK